MINLIVQSNYCGEIRSSLKVTLHQTILVDQPVYEKILHNSFHVFRNHACFNFKWQHTLLLYLAIKTCIIRENHIDFALLFLSLVFS